MYLLFIQEIREYLIKVVNLFLVIALFVDLLLLVVILYKALFERSALLLQIRLVTIFVKCGIVIKSTLNPLRFYNLESIINDLNEILSNRFCLVIRSYCISSS